MNRRARGYAEDVVERSTKRTQKRSRRAAAVARRGLVSGWGWLGSWLGVDRFMIAKTRDCTAWPAAARFGGGWAMVARWWRVGWASGGGAGRPRLTRSARVRLAGRALKQGP